MTTTPTTRTLAKRAATTVKNRRADAAIVRTVGATEAILLARDEATACRRASVALGHWSEDGLTEERHLPATVAAALAGWHKLRGQS